MLRETRLDDFFDRICFKICAGVERFFVGSWFQFTEKYPKRKSSFEYSGGLKDRMSFFVVVCAVTLNECPENTGRLRLISEKESCARRMGKLDIWYDNPTALGGMESLNEHAGQAATQSRPNCAADFIFARDENEGSEEATRRSSVFCSTKLNSATKH